MKYLLWWYNTMIEIVPILLIPLCLHCSITKHKFAQKISGLDGAQQSKFGANQVYSIGPSKIYTLFYVWFESQLQKRRRKSHVWTDLLFASSPQATVLNIRCRYEQLKIVHLTLLFSTWMTNSKTKFGRILLQKTIDLTSHQKINKNTWASLSVFVLIGMFGSVNKLYAILVLNGQRACLLIWRS